MLGVLVARYLDLDRDQCIMKNRPNYLLTLKILSSAKQPYNNPTGYATSSLWRSILNTATKIALAECVHQAILMVERR